MKGKSCKTNTPELSDTRTWKQHFPEGDLWVFGYGSLIWKPPPHFDMRVPGYIEGYVRRFWQASGDHRGTPEALGRVVTVIERSFWETLSDLDQDLSSSTASRVWGAAYHIPTAYAEEVHDYLDEREIDGYTAHYTPFHPVSPPSTAVSSTSCSTPSEGEHCHPFGNVGEIGQVRPPEVAPPLTCMVYIGMPSNPQFLRDPAERDPRAVAQVISMSRGQSGRNTEYLYLLEKALEGLGLGTADGHVTDLVRRVREISRVDTKLGLDEERAEKGGKREMVVDIALELAETAFTAED